MVNGYCFGGGFTQLIACDFALAAEEATFGLSEVNWGSFPAGLVSRVLAEAMSNRDALYYIMTGGTFDGRRAAALGLVNAAYPLDGCATRRWRSPKAAREEPAHAAHVQGGLQARQKEMDYALAEQYFFARSGALGAADPDARRRGIEQFLDGKYKPGLGAYERDG